MSHTQCDARQRSRFELWSSEHWGHRGARGINLAYNAAFLINGGSGSAVWKNATLSNSLIECCEKNNVLPDSGDHDNGQGRVVSTQSHCFLTTPLNQTDSSVLFLLLAGLSMISICCNSILPRPLLSFLLTGLLQYFTSIYHSLFTCLFSA